MYSEVPEAKSIRWVSVMLGGTDQETKGPGFPRTASFYCERAADLIEAQQEKIRQLESQQK